MPRYAAIAVLILLGLICFFVVKESDSGLAVTLAIAFPAMALALAHPSALPRPMRCKRVPGLGDAGAAVVFLVAALLLLCAFEIAVQGDVSSHLSPRERFAERAGQTWSFVWLIAAAMPLLIQIIRPNPAATMGRAGAGVAGGLLLGFGLFIAWASIGERALSAPDSLGVDAVVSAISLPLAGLLCGLGGALWRSGFRLGPWRFRDNLSVFPAAFTAAAAGLCIACLLCADMLAKQYAREFPDTGVIAAAALCIVIGAVWAGLLVRIRSRRPATFSRGLFAVAVLVIAVPVSFLVPGYISGSGGWSGLVVIFAGPLAIILAIGVLTVTYFLIRALFGRAEPAFQSS